MEVDIDDAISLTDGERDSTPGYYTTRTDNALTYTNGTPARAELVPNYLSVT